MQLSEHVTYGSADEPEPWLVVVATNRQREPLGGVRTSQHRQHGC
jgi:hypothetical protein